MMAMTQQKKVELGLQCCKQVSGDACVKCPYQDESKGKFPTCTAHLANDAHQFMFELMHGRPQVITCEECKYSEPSFIVSSKPLVCKWFRDTSCDRNDYCSHAKRKGDD